MISVITTILIYKKIKQYWNSVAVLTFSLFLLAFNNYAIYLTKYPMVSYGTSFLVTTYFYFLFIGFLDKQSKPKLSYWILLCFLMAFFTIVTTVIPIVCGITALFVIKFIKNKKINFINFIKGSSTFLLALIIFSLTYAITYTVHSFNNLGVDKRFDMLPHFYSTSGHEQNIIGAGNFMIQNTERLFLELFALPFRDSVTKPLGFILEILFFIGLGKTIFNWKQSEKDLFTVIYIFLAWFSMLVGGFIGVYPFGTSRYTAFLLVPCLIIISYGVIIVTSCVSPIFKLLMEKLNVKLVIISASVSIIIVGAVLDSFLLNQILNHSKLNSKALAVVNSYQGNLILFSSFINPLLSIKARDIYSSGFDMGWGKYNNLGSDSEVPITLKKKLQEDEGSKLLIIMESTQKLESFPQWKKVIEEYYNLENENVSPAIKILVYKKK